MPDQDLTDPYQRLCREQCRQMANAFPTPNVRLAMRLAEDGTVPWSALYDLFKTALNRGLEAAREVSR